ncbi:MAG TPA: rod shape-determining protein MreC [Clostridia bacterium]|nr:rod shape-determining protein MreC [Clostridia bacterium]
MDFIRRHLNISILAAVLFAQVLGLAVQVKAPGETGSTTLIRRWAVLLITPFEEAFVHTQNWTGTRWREYFYLRDVRRENERLKSELEQLRLEQVRLREDANQARRIQALLAFKEQFISKTLAAQVIGTSGSDQSRILYIDRGANDGVQANMAVITPEGIVGKVLKPFPSSSQVLVINDQTSGVGAILTRTRLQGILKGTPVGEIRLDYVMADEKVEIGEDIVTSGGDRIFPKGLPVGKVAAVSPGRDMFLNIQVKPAANVNGVEEVLVITEVTEKEPDTKDLGPVRASDILAERLPSVPPKPEAPAPAGNPSGAAPAATVNKPAVRATTPAPAANRTDPASGTPATTPKPANASGAAATTPSGTNKPGSAAATNTPKPAVAAETR